MNQAARHTIDPTTIDPEPGQELTAKSGPASTDETDQDLIGVVLARASEGIRRHPFAAVGGAFAVGLVFGRGIPRFVARTAVVMGLRALMQRVLEEPSVGPDSEPASAE